MSRLGVLFLLGLGVVAFADDEPTPAVASGEKDPTRVDPHHPVQAMEPTDSSCSACHAQVPEEGSAPGASALRLAPPEVCATCHPGMPHHGANTHVGQEMESSSLPLFEGKIACFTCHDVHGGVPAGKVDSRLADLLAEVARSTAWAEQADALTFPGTGEGHPPMLRRPLEGGALCRACHEEGP